MIQLPSKKELKELKAFRRPHCLTAYLAFDSTDSDPNHNRIEYKNMLQQAGAALAQAGMRPQLIDKTLAPLHALLDSTEFLTQKHESLAVFAHPALFRMYRIPRDSLAPMLQVRCGFVTSQLENAVGQNKSYFVLALSRKKAQLYRGDLYHLEPIDVKDMPPDMETALQIDEYPHSRQFHSITPGARGAGSAHTHDQAEVKNTDKEMAYEFFKLIDKHIKPILAKSKSPLVIGGVENLLALYGKANSYTGLAGKFIHGNLDHMAPDAIRAKAWPIVQST